jgi:hypothetical protein
MKRVGCRNNNQGGRGQLPFFYRLGITILQKLQSAI